MEIAPHHMAPNGFLHGGAVVTFADSACGCATFAHLPKEAKSFATIELKCNFIGTALTGNLICTVKCNHFGKNTQVWDASIESKENNKIIALFRCTQMLIYT